MLLKPGLEAPRARFLTRLKGAEFWNDALVRASVLPLTGDLQVVWTSAQEAKHVWHCCLDD